jgi:hypothetical protein
LSDWVLKLLGEAFGKARLLLGNLCGEDHRGCPSLQNLSLEMQTNLGENPQFSNQKNRRNMMISIG